MAELYAGRSLTEQTSWSFLALMWGLVADVDLESEACRCFGAARFDVYSAVRVPLSSAVLVPVPSAVLVLVLLRGCVVLRLLPLWLPHLLVLLALLRALLPIPSL